MASARARSAAPTVSAARPDGDVVVDPLPQPGLVPRGSERDHRRLVEDEAGQLAGRVEGRDELDGRRRGRRLEQVRAHALLAAGDDDDPVGRVAVHHEGLLAGETHCARLAAGRVAHGAERSPCPCSPTATVPRRVPAARSPRSSVAPRARAASVAATAEEKNGPGSGMRPICSSTMVVSSRPAPAPPWSRGRAGRSSRGRPGSTTGRA